MSSIKLSVEDVLHKLKIQEGFEDEYCTNLNEEISDHDAPRGDFTTSNGEQMLIDCGVITEKGFKMFYQLSTLTEWDSLLLLDEEVREEIDYSSNNSNTVL